MSALRKGLSFGTSVLVFFLTIMIAIPASAQLLNENHLQASEQSTITIFKRISPLVVNVHNVQEILQTDIAAMQIRRSAGSGFIWNEDGYVITNFHVIRNANKIVVTFMPGQNVMATLVGADQNRDIAVIKVDDTKYLKNVMPFKQFPLADSSKIEVGQTAIAIGNPFGLDHTLTKGVVSALNRKVPGVSGVMMQGLIQTDASINPGNSGGPLLDSSGNLIGMNTLIVSSSGSSVGVGFAVPSNDIKLIVEKIFQYVKVFKDSFGLLPLSDALSAQIKVRGVVIARVIPNGIAERVGLRGISRNNEGKLVVGDIITAIDGRQMDSMHDLYRALQTKKSGDKVVITYMRNGESKSVEVIWP